MFKEQEQALIKILFSSTNTLNQRLDKLKEICKETDNLKLSLDASLNVYEDKLNKLEKIIEFEKEKNRTELEKV